MQLSSVSDAASETDGAQATADPVTDETKSTSVLTSVANGYTDEGEELTDEQKAKINEFLLLLATCNTVVVSSHSHNLSMSMVSIHSVCLW